MSQSAYATTAAFLACVCYSNNETLHGKFIYDDKATVQFHPIVTGTYSYLICVDEDENKRRSSIFTLSELVAGISPLSDILHKDFWGQNNLTDPESHKSFRPITTFTCVCV